MVCLNVFDNLRDTRLSYLHASWEAEHGAICLPCSNDTKPVLIAESQCTRHQRKSKTKLRLMKLPGMHY